MLNPGRTTVCPLAVPTTSVMSPTSTIPWNHFIPHLRLGATRAEREQCGSQHVRDAGMAPDLIKKRAMGGVRTFAPWLCHYREIEASVASFERRRKSR